VEQEASHEFVDMAADGGRVPQDCLDMEDVVWI